MPYKDFKSTEIIDEIGLELRKLRNEKKLSLATVSDAMEQQQIHISGTMLGRMENGERRIDDSLLHALCRLYDADPNALIIRACQTHILALQVPSSPDVSIREQDTDTLLQLYRQLPQQARDEARTMLRLLSYKERFKDI